MTWKLNRKGYDHAKGLIQAGKVNDGKWEKPNLEDFKDIEEYALFHLGKDPEADPNTAEAYAYPYGRGGEVYIQALRAIKSYTAGARGAPRNQEIYDAASELLEMAKEEASEKTYTLQYGNHAVKINKDKRLVTGPVLVPDEPDLDGDVVTAEQVEEVAYKFMEDYQNIDIMHKFRNVARPVESYILRDDEEINGVHLPRGTWMITARIYDDDIWQGVKTGKYTGFSITAVPAQKAQKSYPKTTLRELGWPWEVVTISIVDKPAVPKAKYLSIKRDGGDDVDEKSLLKQIFTTLKSYFDDDEGGEAVKDEKQEPEPEEEITTNTILEAIQELKKEISKIHERLNEMVEEDDDEDEDKVNPEQVVDEAATSKAEPQSLKGQVAEKKHNDASDLQIMGVDRFGRPIKR